MYDYQLLQSTYCIVNGIDEDKEDDQIKSTEDLDHLYSKIKTKEGA